MSFDFIQINHFHSNIWLLHILMVCLPKFHKHSKAEILLNLSIHIIIISFYSIRMCPHTRVKKE